MAEATAAVRCLTVHSLGEWAESWDTLVSKTPVPTPFLRSWWLAAVAERDAEFLLFLRDGALVGGLAIEQRRRVLGVPVYRFCGSGPLCPDHLDLLVDRHHRPAVCRALYDDWWTRPGSRVLDLDGVVEGSVLEAMFGPAATRPIDIAPWDELPADAADFLAARSPNVRKALRQAQRRFAAAGVTHRRIAPDEIDRALLDFQRLQQARGDREVLLSELPAISGPCFAR